MTKEQRHRCMAAIHSKDTKPEMLVRKYLFARFGAHLRSREKQPFPTWIFEKKIKLGNYYIGYLYGMCIELDTFQVA